MKTNQSMEEAKGNFAKGDLKPKDAVRRILEAAGAEVADKEAFWLGHHMERFVNHTQKHGELGGWVCLINPAWVGGASELNAASL